MEEDGDPRSPHKAVELKLEPSGIYDEEQFEDGGLDEYTGLRMRNSSIFSNFM